MNETEYDERILRLEGALQKVDAERDALMAYVDRLGEFLQVVDDDLNGCHDNDGLLRQALRDVRDLTPQISLAQRDAQKQAEALEQAADELGNNAGGEIDYSELMARADQLRRQAGLDQ